MPGISLVEGSAQRVRVTGLRELNQFLVEKLPAKAAGRTLNRALRVAAKPIVAAAKNNAKRARNPHSFALSQSIQAWVARKRIRKHGLAGSLMIGPRRSHKPALVAYYDFYDSKRLTPQALENGIRHGHLVEWGTSQSSANPFMRPALDQNAARFIRSFADILGNEIEKETRKHERQTRKAKR